MFTHTVSESSYITQEQKKIYSGYSNKLESLEMFNQHSVEQSFLNGKIDLFFNKRQFISVLNDNTKCK